MPAQTNGPFPNIQSKHSLVASHVTKDKWEQLKGIKTKTSGFTLIQAIACAVEFDNQHCGIYAGDWDSYKDFAPVFDPLIQEYHGISSTAVHTFTGELAGKYYPLTGMQESIRQQLVDDHFL